MTTAEQIAQDIVQGHMCIPSHVPRIAAIIQQAIDDATKERRLLNKSRMNETLGLRATNKALREACETFLRVWGHAGPNGSAQWEKFDVVLNAIENALGDKT